MHFGCTIIPIFIEIASHYSVKLDPKKIKAVKNLEMPKTKCALQSFLRMINCIAKYTPKAKGGCKPLREFIPICSDYK